MALSTCFSVPSFAHGTGECQLPNTRIPGPYVLFTLTFKEDFFITWKAESPRGTARALPCTGSLPRWPQGQQGASCSQEPPPGLPVAAGAQPLGRPHCFPRCVSVEWLRRGAAGIGSIIYVECQALLPQQSDRSSLRVSPPPLSCGSPACPQLAGPALGA